MPRTDRAKILSLLLLAGGVAIGALIWQAATRTTSSTSGKIGGGDVSTQANNVQDCMDQAQAFTDYPLVWAGPSVLGYPLVSCSHMMTKTRYDEQGRISHPGGDSWSFAYGSCTPRKGQESCPLPVGIIVDPCALTADGGSIPKASAPVRSTTVRGAKADISDAGVLSFEQAPQLIEIYAPEGPADERAKQAMAIAEALVPANDAAYSLLRGAPITAAFATSPDTLCRNSFVSDQKATPTAVPPEPLTLVAGLGIAIGAPSLSGAKVRVPVNTTGTGLPAYAGLNIHVRWDSAVFSFDSANSTGGVIAGPLCASFADSDGGGARYACISGGTTTSAGLLATLVLTPAASGCSPLHLFTLAPPDSGDQITGTYIFNLGGETLEPAQYTDGTANVSGQPC